MSKITFKKLCYSIMLVFTFAAASDCEVESHDSFNFPAGINTSYVAPNGYIVSHGDIVATSGLELAIFNKSGERLGHKTIPQSFITHSHVGYNSNSTLTIYTLNMTDSSDRGQIRRETFNLTTNTFSASMLVTTVPSNITLLSPFETFITGTSNYIYLTGSTSSPSVEKVVRFDLSNNSWDEFPISPATIQGIATGNPAKFLGLSSVSYSNNLDEVISFEIGYDYSAVYPTPNSRLVARVYDDSGLDRILVFPSIYEPQRTIAAEFRDGWTFATYNRIHSNNTVRFYNESGTEVFDTELEDAWPSSLTYISDDARVHFLYGGLAPISPGTVDFEYAGDIHQTGRLVLTED